MNNIFQILESLANSKDSMQFKQRLAAYNTRCKRDMDLQAMKGLQFIEDVWVLGRHRR